MNIERITLMGKGLPLDVEPAPKEKESRLCFQSLGPILDCATMMLLEDLFRFADKADLHILGYLCQPAYEVLTGSFMKYSSVAQHLRPVACSFTELQLSPAQIQELPFSRQLMDQVMELYVSNLLDDVQFFMDVRLPQTEFQITGSYLSHQSGEYVLCRPRPRIMTPRFGTLTFVVRDSEPLAVYPKKQSREV
jgi:hypothetical protein